MKYYELPTSTRKRVDEILMENYGNLDKLKKTYSLSGLFVFSDTKEGSHCWNRLNHYIPITTPNIYDLYEEEQVKQGNRADWTVLINYEFTSRLNGGISWAGSTEGNEFWSNNLDNSSESYFYNRGDASVSLMKKVEESLKLEEWKDKATEATVIGDQVHLDIENKLGVGTHDVIVQKIERKYLSPIKLQTLFA